MNQHPAIATSQRLLLRPLTESDAPALFNYRNQPEVTRFQGWTPDSPGEVADYARAMAARPAAEPGHWYQVVCQLTATESNPVVGDVAFCIDTETRQQAELGIALDTAYQKLGYAQEAIIALVDYLFTQHQLHRIHVSIDPQNSGSLKLFSRVGFRLEGHLKQSMLFRGQWCDDVIMAVLRAEWLARPTD